MKFYFLKSKTIEKLRYYISIFAWCVEKIEVLIKLFEKFTHFLCAKIPQGVRHISGGGGGGVKHILALKIHDAYIF